MDKNAQPLDALIEFALASGADTFWVNNAKDELKRLRQNNYKAVGWARINDRGDLYDLRLCYNPYLDPTTIVTLYSNDERLK